MAGSSVLARPEGSIVVQELLALGREGFDGWQLRSMRHALQPKSDDYQCGIWCHVVLECLVKYLESAEAPSSAGFDLFVAQQHGFRPIPASGTTEQQRTATRANTAHATEVRATLRAVLWQAAVAQTLPYGLNAQLEHLGDTAAEGIDLVAEDAEAPREEEEEEGVGFVEG